MLLRSKKRLPSPPPRRKAPAVREKSPTELYIERLLTMINGVDLSCDARTTHDGFSFSDDDHKVRIHVSIGAFYDARAIGILHEAFRKPGSQIHLTSFSCGNHRIKDRKTNERANGLEVWVRPPDVDIGQYLSEFAMAIPDLLTPWNRGWKLVKSVDQFPPVFSGYSSYERDVTIEYFNDKTYVGLIREERFIEEEMLIRLVRRDDPAPTVWTYPIDQKPPNSALRIVSLWIKTEAFARICSTHNIVVSD